MTLNNWCFCFVSFSCSYPLLLLSIAEELLPRNPFFPNHAIEKRVETVVDTSKMVINRINKPSMYHKVHNTGRVNRWPENPDDKRDPANYEAEHQYRCNLDSTHFCLSSPPGSLLTQCCLWPPVEVENHGCVAAKHGDQREKTERYNPIDVKEKPPLPDLAVTCAMPAPRFCIQLVYDTVWNGAD